MDLALVFELSFLFVAKAKKMLECELTNRKNKKNHLFGVLEPFNPTGIPRSADANNRHRHSAPGGGPILVAQGNLVVDS